MNSDFKDLLRILFECEVRFLVAGGYAGYDRLHHSQPRYTKDIDIWIEPSPRTTQKIMRAFRIFGVPDARIVPGDLATPGTQLNIGVPPCEIDFLTTIPGLDFESAWPNRVISKEEEHFSIPYLGKSDLILAKQTAGRPQDLADLDELRLGPHRRA